MAKPQLLKPIDNTSKVLNEKYEALLPDLGPRLDEWNAIYDRIKSKRRKEYG